MTQRFDIEWSGGQITSVLISALLHDYFRMMRHPIGELSVKEITNEECQEMLAKPEAQKAEESK